MHGSCWVDIEVPGFQTFFFLSYEFYTLSGLLAAGGEFLSISWTLSGPLSAPQ